jgi:DNA-binding protein HU-beta
MIKNDIVEKIADGSGLNKTVVKKIVDEFLGTVSEALAEEQRVELRGFGVFEFRPVKSRVGRNPKTGEEVVIPAGNKLVFKSSKIIQKSRGRK